MMTLTLKRGREQPHGILGSLYLDNKFLCFTLEEPWRDNKPRISSIPEGTYKCIQHGWEPDTKVKFKRVWHLLNVPGRSAILIHAGNTIDDTEGCILVGLSATPNGVGRSRDAVDMLRRILPATFMIEVQNPI